MLRIANMKTTFIQSKSNGFRKTITFNEFIIEIITHNIEINDITPETLLIFLFPFESIIIRL
jgi:hypothetical protein